MVSAVVTSSTNGFILGDILIMSGPALLLHLKSLSCFEAHISSFGPRQEQFTLLGVRWIVFHYLGFFFECNRALQPGCNFGLRPLSRIFSATAGWQRYFRYLTTSATHNLRLKEG